jgi:CheY-like chemotaxis protein
MMTAFEKLRIRVLLVEDEPLVREITAEALLGQGLDVRAAASGEEALRELRRGDRCDVLFTDVNLGRGIDGVALSWEARRLRPGLPVVYASGAVGGLAQLRAVAAASFLRKPYEPKAAAVLLRAVVAELALARAWLIG